MRRRRFVFVLIAVLALIVPAVTTAQGGIGNSVVLTASLHGDADIPPGDPDGFGFAKVRIDLVTSQVCYRLSVAATDTPVAAHIHHGAAGTNGPVVVPFTAPADGLSNGCVDITADLAAAIANNPSEYYVNVHTATFPAGAVRGQLDWLGGQPGFRMPSVRAETIADGLTNPRGLDIAADGTVYVTEAGMAGDECVTVTLEEEEFERCLGETGAITRIAGGDQEQVVTGLPALTFMGEIVGPHDVVVGDDGTLHAVVGLGGPPDQRDLFSDAGDLLGHLISVNAAGAVASVADVSAYEATANPAGGPVDTNPYSLVSLDDGGYVVSDAGMNALLHVAADGTVSTLAVFPDKMADAPPFLGLPEGTQIPMEAVPTGVVQGPDGAFYVGQLTGFPFEVGSASVWRVEDMNGDGDALDDGETTVYASGFTNIIDVAVDDAGNLYV
ncbi:MAG TPA: ScyD/ScyE family protein, partial [Thermomicrobiales bacterium]|nr:ScyD/ScyE family protein [Thermomicrobiales bacterium]